MYLIPTTLSVLALSTCGLAAPTFRVRTPAFEIPGKPLQVTNSTQLSSSTNGTSADALVGVALQRAGSSFNTVGNQANKTGNTDGDAGNLLKSGGLALLATDSSLKNIQDALKGKKTPSLDDMKNIVEGVKQAEDVLSCMPAAIKKQDKDLSADITSAQKDVAGLQKAAEALLKDQNKTLSDLKLPNDIFSQKADCKAALTGNEAEAQKNNNSSNSNNSSDKNSNSNNNANNNNGNNNSNNASNAISAVQKAVGKAEGSFAKISSQASSTGNDDVTNVVNAGGVGLLAVLSGADTVGEAVDAKKTPAVEDLQSMVLGIKQANDAVTCMTQAIKKQDKTLSDDITAGKNAMTTLVKAAQDLLNTQNKKVTPEDLASAKPDCNAVLTGNESTANNNNNSNDQKALDAARKQIAGELMQTSSALAKVAGQAKRTNNSDVETLAKDGLTGLKQTEKAVGNANKAVAAKKAPAAADQKNTFQGIKTAKDAISCLKAAVKKQDKTLSDDIDASQKAMDGLLKGIQDDLTAQKKKLSDFGVSDNLFSQKADCNGLLKNSNNKNNNNNNKNENNNNNNNNNNNALDQARKEIVDGLAQTAVLMDKVAFIANNTGNSDVVKLVQDGSLQLGAIQQAAENIGQAINAKKTPSANDQKAVLQAAPLVQQVGACLDPATKKQDASLKAAIASVNTAIGDMVKGINDNLKAQNKKLSDFGLSDNTLSQASAKNCKGSEIIVNNNNSNNNNNNNNKAVESKSSSSSSSKETSTSAAKATATSSSVKASSSSSSSSSSAAKATASVANKAASDNKVANTGPFGVL